MPSSPEINCRFEAIVIAGDGAPIGEARLAIEQLADAGLAVEIVGREGLDDVIDEMWRRGIAPAEIARLVDGNVPRPVLEQQLELRRRRAQPIPPTPPSWSVALNELDDGRERVRDALLALADGRFGIVGSLIGRQCSSNPCAGSARFQLAQSWSKMQRPACKPAGTARSAWSSASIAPATRPRSEHTARTSS